MYKIFFYEGKKCSIFSSNIKVDAHGDISFSVKKMGIVVYKRFLKKKKYKTSDVFKFTHLEYQQLINFLRDDHASMQFFVEGYNVFIDNEQKKITIKEK